MNKILLLLSATISLCAAQLIDEDVTNINSTTGYGFKPYDDIESFRERWNWFMVGANSTHYAPNSSVCFNQALDFWQYDTDLLAIKLMFGNFKENMLNTTVFAGNASDVMVVCVDAGENLFVWTQYKFETFGNKWNNVMLAGIQNILGRVLTI